MFIVKYLTAPEKKTCSKMSTHDNCVSKVEFTMEVIKYKKVKFFCICLIWKLCFILTLTMQPAGYPVINL